ncbi:MAG TPA: hypothetical protein ENG83_11205 [Nitrospirae bacterium]|nr:endonuclease/Exonuclease/phosphatase family protein [bacterium BMS3Abin06]HDH12741.1 hypothetical protein [Nitrospirota bacterium]HDZ00050.1 hypothetical protein [Nitrospirota bacterium]
MKRYNKLLLFCLISLYLLSFVRYLDNIDYWIIDILSHFPLQYALISLVLMSVCLWKKALLPAVLSGFLVVFNISAIIDSGGSIQAAGQSGTAFRIYSANIQRFNKDLSRLSHEIEKINPEIVLLIEVTPEHMKQLKPVIRKFPYHIEFTPVGTLRIGVVFLSKFPVLNYQTRQMSDVGNVLVEAILDINQKKIAFYALHYRNPTYAAEFSIRKEQFLWLAEEIAEKPMPVIVAGDFNATPYSPIFRKLLKISGLKDSTDGFGWQPSWPTYFPPLWIPIDHILVSPEIQVHKRATGSYIGSDHYPVFAELSIN